MTYKLTAFAATVAVSAMTLSATALAGSFALTTQSLSSRSMANAGAGVQANDATALYSNPAAMSKIKAPSVSVGLAMVKPTTEISNASATVYSQSLLTGVKTTVGSVSGTNNGDIAPDAMVPSAYYVTPVKTEYLQGVSMGIGVYSPFGFHGNYEDSFQGRLFGDHSKLVIKTIAPSVSMDVSSIASVGASVTLNSAEAYLSAVTTPVASGVGVFTPAGDFSIKGDDKAIGYTLGALITPNDMFKLGLVYRSQVHYIFEGQAKLKTPASATTFASDAFLRLTTPDSYELAIGVTPTSGLNLNASYTNTRWKSIQELQVNAPSLPTTIPAEQIRYNNSHTIALGADFAINPKLTVRGGVAKDNTPTTDTYRSLRIPTTDRMVYALGANYKFSPTTSIDVGYSYLVEDDAKISQAKSLKALNATTVLGTSYDGTFTSSAHIGMLQLNHSF